MSKSMTLPIAIKLLCKGVQVSHGVNPMLSWEVHRIPMYFLKERQGAAVRQAYPVTIAALEKQFGEVVLARSESMVYPEIDRMERLDLEDRFKTAMTQIRDILQGPIDYETPAKVSNIILGIYNEFVEKVMRPPFFKKGAV